MFQSFTIYATSPPWGGKLYISVPVGSDDAVAFNAHRIFKPETIIDTLNVLTLTDFSLIQTDWKIGTKYIEHVDYKKFDLSMDYGGGTVGLFEFLRK